MKETIEIPKWLAVRIISALAYVDGYIEGLGKESAFLSAERVEIESRLLQAIASIPKEYHES